MEVYLVRHTKPSIEKDFCYGQTDVPIDASFFEPSAKNILSQLPEKVDALYSSPLIRCNYLANYIEESKYPKITIEYSELLKEVNFGDWENKKWNDINQVDLHVWMNDFVNQKPPGGESFIKLHQRTKHFIEYLLSQSYVSVVIVTHAGVIRSIKSHIQQSLLNDAFSINCDYGSVTRLTLI
jgi:alpha-ribazole phosphatase